MSHNSYVKQAVYGDNVHPLQPIPPNVPKPDDQPRLWGMPLKYISLITLAVQNASLTIIMHYSRVSSSPDKSYSAGSAVLLNELLKGSISLIIALLRIDDNVKARSTTTSPPSASSASSDYKYNLIARSKKVIQVASPPSVLRLCSRWIGKWRRLGREVFSPDCWKLSIPAILYVIQNNLQFVAASNLDVATFQVTYQMKILTTAAFSVVMLRKKLTSVKWLALLGLALGVGIVQIQNQPSHSTPTPVEEVSAEELAHVAEVIANTHVMHPLTGFLAVALACLTSGLAGVYFEMVLKGSQADLWVRNVQLSLFSLLPALVPVIFNTTTSTGGHWFWDLFKNFGGWAWATVLMQVFGGLITAIVIKYADNIMKGFATSLSIIISSLASVALFDTSITTPFVVGASVVLGSTWVYNKPDKRIAPASSAVHINKNGSALDTDQDEKRRPSTTPGSPIEPDAPILGQPSPPKKRTPFATPTPRSIAVALGLSSRSSSVERLGSVAVSRNPSRSNSAEQIPSTLGMTPMNNVDLAGSGDLAASPYRSETPTPLSSRPPTRPPSTRPYQHGSNASDASSGYGETLQPQHVPAGWKAA